MYRNAVTGYGIAIPTYLHVPSEFDERLFCKANGWFWSVDRSLVVLATSRESRSEHSFADDFQERLACTRFGLVVRPVDDPVGEVAARFAQLLVDPTRRGYSRLSSSEIRKDKNFKRLFLLSRSDTFLALSEASV
jgi:hypothetical protein